jgi:hypothetical protein
LQTKFAFIAGVISTPQKEHFHCLGTQTLRIMTKLFLFNRVNPFLTKPDRSQVIALAPRISALSRKNCGGGGGIRTHESLRSAGFQDRSHQPLDHPSGCARYGRLTSIARGRFGEPPLPRNHRMGSRELFQKAQVILREESNIRNFE